MSNDIAGPEHSDDRDRSDALTSAAHSDDVDGVSGREQRTALSLIHI